MSITQLMNATTADVEDRAAQTSYSDSVLTAMKQVHDTIEQLEVRPVCLTYTAKTNFICQKYRKAQENWIIKLFTTGGGRLLESQHLADYHCWPPMIYMCICIHV